MRVIIKDGQNFESAMRKFKKKITDNGLLQELRDRECYDKPSVHRKLAKGQARRRWQKQIRSQQLPKKLY